MNSVLQRVYEIGIIPVIAFNSVDEALPLCKALMAGGLPAAEVTFRTACAEECIKKIHEELPDMLLGAGTVLLFLPHIVSEQEHQFPDLLRR